MMLYCSYPEELATTSFLPVKVKCFYNLPKTKKKKATQAVTFRGEREINQKKKKKNLTRFLASTGTPEALVERRSLDFEGDNENLIVSPKLIT